MKITSLVIYNTVVLLCSFLYGCVATQMQMLDADKLAEKYQRITQLTAFQDEQKTLYLCVDILKQDNTSPQKVTLEIPWLDFERMAFTTLIAKGGGEYLLDATDYKAGCSNIEQLTPITITEINIDKEIGHFDDLQPYLNNLATDNSGYSLYLMTSEKFKMVEYDCGSYKSDKKCIADQSYAWPRIVIKAKTRNDRPPVSIVSGHTGEKRGLSAGPTAKATLIDVLTFPVQAIFFTGWYVSGVDH